MRVFTAIAKKPDESCGTAEFQRPVRRQYSSKHRCEAQIRPIVTFNPQEKLPPNSNELEGESPQEKYDADVNQRISELMDLGTK